MTICHFRVMCPRHKTGKPLVSSKNSFTRFGVLLNILIYTTCKPRAIRVMGDGIFSALAKRRAEYQELLQVSAYSKALRAHRDLHAFINLPCSGFWSPQHYYYKDQLSVEELKLLRQLRVDLPRTHAGRKFFAHERIQK